LSGCRGLGVRNLGGNPWFALVDFVLNLMFLGALRLNHAVHHIVAVPIVMGFVCALAPLVLWLIRTEDAQAVLGRSLKAPKLTCRARFAPSGWGCVSERTDNIRR